MNEKELRRAGLDYAEWVNVKEYPNFPAFLSQQKEVRAQASTKIFACSTKASQHHSSVIFQDNDYLLFGPESRGLPPELLHQFSDTLIRIPMQKNSRSLNLSNAVAVILYEALRQLGYPNSA